MTSTDHVEFYWFPHTDVTLLKCNTRVPLEEGLAPLPRWRAVWDDEILANGAFAGVVAAGRRVPALVPPLARMSAKALGARTWTDHVAPGLRQPPPGPLPGDGVRGPARRRRPPCSPSCAACTRPNDWRVAVPGGGAGRRRRRHPAVDGVGARQRLHRRARARGNGSGAVVRRARGDRRRGRRPAALGQAARSRRRRAAHPVPAVRRVRRAAGPARPDRRPAAQRLPGPGAGPPVGSE